MDSFSEYNAIRLEMSNRKLKIYIYETIQNYSWKDWNDYIRLEIKITLPRKYDCQLRKLRKYREILLKLKSVVKLLTEYENSCSYQDCVTIRKY